MKKLIAISLSLILALVLVCAASAETVQAKPVEIDPSNLEGRMVRTDIEYKEGDKMQLTLYVPERFDAAAIQAVPERWNHGAVCPHGHLVHQRAFYQAGDGGRLACDRNAEG